MRFSGLGGVTSQEKNPPTRGPVLALRTDLDEMLQQHTQDLMDELRSGAQKTP